MVWKFNGRIREIFTSRPKRKGYASVDVENPGYLEIRIKEPQKEEVRTMSVDQVRKNRDEEAKKRMTEEIRKRALEEDRKFR